MRDSNITREGQLRTMQVIAGALPAGVVLFALIAVLIAVNSQSAPLEGQGVSLFLAGFAAVLLVAHLKIPSVLSRPLTDPGAPHDDASLLQALQALTIIKLAILEAAAAANLVAYLLQRHWWSLAIAGVLVLWMLAQFPTRLRVDRWLDDTRRAVG